MYGTNKEVTASMAGSIAEISSISAELAGSVQQAVFALDQANLQQQAVLELLSSTLTPEGIGTQIDIRA